jgi:uncharacterized protein
MLLDVRAHPRASRAKLEWDGSVLHVWVSSPPVEGAANRALLKAVADGLGVPAGRVSLAGGPRSRSKRVEVSGLEAGALERLRP